LPLFAVEGKTIMKNLSITAVFLGVLAMGLSAPPAKAQVQVSISIGGFYDELDPYGRWIDCRYGECWVPERVGYDWQPYSNGEWIYTEYGWTWVSYDPWGESPYHYGTWVYLDRYGWSWVPGTVWAPAWVTWSYSDNYVGWAPLPPDYAFGYSGYSGRPIVLASTRYVFVPTNRFVGTNVRTVRVAPQQTATIFRQTTPITRFAVTSGIVRNTALPVERIQRATRSRIETRRVRSEPRPISGWSSRSQRSVSIVAPAAEVKRAFAARPQRAPERDRSDRINRGTETRQAPQAQPVQPAQPVYRERERGRPEARRQAAPAQPQPEYRGRGRVENPPAAPPPQVQRQQPAPPNPATLEKSQRGRAPEKSAKPPKGQGKAKGKDKDKDN
jgi:uncharacterized protein DUF6600